MRSTQRFERVGNRGRQRTSAIAAELRVNVFEAADQIEHCTPFIITAGRCAKMRAAAKRPAVVDQALALLAEQRAGSIRALRQLFPTTRPQRIRSDDRFAARQKRGAAGELEMAAAGAPHARALDRAPRELRVNCTHFRRRDFGGNISRSHFHGHKFPQRRPARNFCPDASFFNPSRASS